MKKAIMAAVIAGGLVASSALAIPSSGEIEISQKDGYHQISGGEYTITSTAFDEFQSFCLEYTESVHWPPLYYTLNTGAVMGGGSYWGPDGVQGFDPISRGTAWLFKQFSSGTWDAYNYTPGAGRAESARNLQLAIWNLEDESGFTTPGAQAFIALAQQALGGNITLADNGDQGVYVMNIVDRSGEASQDMLALPDGGATLSLLGLGLMGLGMASRRLRRA